MTGSDMKGTVLAVDGNSLVHRAFHAQAGTGLRTPAGEPIWAVRGLVAQLLEAIERLDPIAVVIGFDDADRSDRRVRWPQYKAQRVEKLPTLVSQLASAIGILTELGVPVVVPPGLEADDVLASTAARAREHGHHAVLMTSDRDAFALIDESTSVLRILNGGVAASPLLTPARLRLLLDVSPEQYRDYAALRGDASDNLPGVRGIGPKTAARLMAALGSARAIFDDVAAGGAVVTECAGPALAARLADPVAARTWELNCAVMAPHRDVDLPEFAPLRPLSVDAVRRTCALLQMPAALPRALRLLSGVEPADAPVRLAWSAPTVSAGPDREQQEYFRPNPLPARRIGRLPKPVVVDQLSLFSL